MKKESNQPSTNHSAEPEEVSTTVPPAMLPENQPQNVHTRSHAAHLDTGSREPQTKPAGDLRRAGSHPTGRKQP